MSLKMKKEELELLSNKDIAELILNDSKKTMNTATLFKKIIKLLELPESVFETKIAEFYTALSTDKRFILIDGKWDLRINHTSDKVIKLVVEDDDEEEETEENENDQEDENNDDDEDNYDDTEDNDYDDETNEELKDLVVIDENELELEE